MSLSPADSSAAAAAPGFPPAVLHYVFNCWPDEVGYSIRTHAIATQMARQGVRVSVARQALHGVGTGQGTRLKLQAAMEHEGVAYLNLPESVAQQAGGGLPISSRLDKIGFFRRMRGRHLLSGYAHWLNETAGKPALLHAHTPPEVALDGAVMAKSMGIPLVYEVRGFWGLSRAVEYGIPIPERLAVAADARAARGAKCVVAICQGIADLLVRGGIPANKVHVVPNGVEMSRFPPLERDAALAERLGLTGRVVFAYATNVRKMEGIQTLIRAWPEVKRRVPEAVFLLLGDGQYLPALQAQAKAIGLDDSFRFLGRVPHREMRSYYSLFDVFIVPRIPEPVCQLVTPLKPLEAMAMGVPVLSSDVEAMKEIVADGETGLLFRAGDPVSLADACVTLASNATLRTTLAERARQWVAAERDWGALVGHYRGIYAEALR